MGESPGRVSQSDARMGGMLDFFEEERLTDFALAVARAKSYGHLSPKGRQDLQSIRAELLNCLRNRQGVRRNKWD